MSQLAPEEFYAAVLEAWDAVGSPDDGEAYRQVQSMFYRIMMAPPGYSSDQKYMVAVYDTIDFNSKSYNLTKPDGSMFYATLQEARGVIPSSARRLPFEQVYQFLELWSE